MPSASSRSDSIAPHKFGGAHWQPEPLLTVSQWADERRRLSRRSGAAEDGPWSTDRVPWMREPMDAFSDPLVEEITLLFATQMAKTEGMLNMLGWSIDCDPDPALYVLPRDSDVARFGPLRVKPMIEDSPTLAAHITGVEDDLAGEVYLLDNLRLRFAISGSPADLASEPARYLFGDEMNKFPRFSGKDASPMALAGERQTTYRETKKTVGASTPTGPTGAITLRYALSDRRLSHVPCPHCNAYQPLSFRDDPLRKKHRLGCVRWPVGATAEEIRLSHLAWYECGWCEQRIEEKMQGAMVAAGVWVPHGATITASGKVEGVVFSTHRGYRISKLYSPWVTWSDVAAKFLAVKSDPPELMNFVNGWLAEEFEDRIEVATPESLYDRREAYGPEVPAGALILIAGVDVQDNRFEVEILASGAEFETWSLEYLVIPGYPSQPGTWAALDDVLLKRYQHASGVTMPIAAAGVDTGGHHTREAYEFCRPRWARRNEHGELCRVLALKGSNKDLPFLVSKPTRNNIGRLPLYLFDPSRAKRQLFAWLKTEQHGPKYQHFPTTYDEAYFQGLTAETQKTTYVRGAEKRVWEKKAGRRNEPLDCRNMAMVALTVALQHTSWSALRQQVDALHRATEHGIPVRSVGQRRILHRGVSG